MDNLFPRVDHHRVSRRPRLFFFGKKRLSGAQRRKRKRAAIKQAKYANGTQNNSEVRTPNKEEVFKVGIVCQNYPEEIITLEQLDLIRNYLATMIDELSTEEFIPRLDTIECQGGVIVLCKDQQTVSWLKSFIPDCKPWDGADLKVIEAEEFLIRVMLWIPGPKVDDNVIFNRIQKQNSGVYPDKWHVWTRTDELDGISFDISMDKESFEKTKCQDWKLYCGAVTAVASRPKQKQTNEEPDSV